MFSLTLRITKLIGTDALYNAFFSSSLVMPMRLEMGEKFIFLNERVKKNRDSLDLRVRYS